MYLYTILKNHTAHACEGDTLTIKCPSRTSVTVLSAFYGRRVPNQFLCPSVNSDATVEQDAECTSPVAIQVYGLKCQIHYWSFIRSAVLMFFHACRRCWQNASIASPVTSLSSAQCLDWILVHSPPNIFLSPTSADQVGG